MKTLQQVILIFLGALVGFLLAGCGTSSLFSAGKGSKYSYTFSLARPTESRNLLYRDDSLMVQFRFDEAAIRFQLQNLSRNDLRIDWEKASIGVNGQFSATRHATTLYGDTGGIARTQTLPSYGYVRELLMPRQNIGFDGKRWNEQDLLPTMDNGSKTQREAILKSAGQTVSLILPVCFGKADKTLRFDFKVDSVKQIAWRDYAPQKRIPAPPTRSAGTIDQLTAAVLTVGVLGFTAFLLTAKKNPPTE